MVSHSLVYVDNSVTGWTAVLHILTGINAERDTAAKTAPKDGEAAADSPGQQARFELRVGGH